MRHNLSINPHFRKGKKAPQGAGHLWELVNSGMNQNNLENVSKREITLFIRIFMYIVIFDKNTILHHHNFL